MNALIDKRIRYLDLSENFITLDGLEIIANFLKNNKTLQKLNLCRNAQCQFKPDGVKLITEALIQNPNIEFIDFSYMNLTGCGVYIGNFISENKNIKSIILRNVMLNAVDFKNIFVPLKNNDVLQEIDISLNDMGGDKSLQYIADAIIENKTLHTVKMDQININNDNYEIIFKAIEQNKTITSYSVNFNSKIKPMIMLNFFIKQKHVKHLEYDPFDKENPNDKKKELTLEEKKMFSKFKTERPDMKLIYK
jgi:Ran GTPase-activating protein (RanGAP) involved in mRNA processing and transport